MFLALTADERFWDSTKPILFLGDWCRLYSRREIWKSLPHQVMEYPWNDRRRITSQYSRINALYESALASLSQRLNEIHGIDHAPAFWRILIGPWLYYHTYALFERYTCLEAAVRSGLAQTTTIPSEDQHAVPMNFAHATQLLSGDGYNHLLYGQILRSTKMIPWQARDFALNFETGATSSRPAVAHPSFLAKLKESVFHSRRRENRIFIEPMFRASWHIWLHLRLGQPVTPALPTDVMTPRPVQPALRQKLRFPEQDDPFGKLLMETLSLNVPTNYLEGFKDTLSEARVVFPERCRAIVVGSSLIMHDLFKTWAAGQKERGAKLIGVQHGGQYGCGLWNSDEDHERNVTDRYFSWGWTDPTRPNVVPVDGFRLVPCLKATSNPRGKILLILMSVPRYSYFMCSIPIASQQHSYINDVLRFSRALGENVRPLMRTRLYPRDYGWSERARLSDAQPPLAIDDTPGTMIEQFSRCRLMVVSYNATAILECMAADIPTLMFWNPDHSELRAPARPSFEELRQAGILHDTPESAAAQVERIYEDPLRWWQDTERQRVRERFCRTYAYATPEWFGHWRGELQKLLAPAEVLS